ncbi:MAG: hypothetical protein ACP5HS_00250 [Anaerolineae bacterium]
MTQQSQQLDTSRPLRRIAQTWWPLAVSWLLMAIEGPAHSAVVARLVNPEVNLAAWGGIVYPIALIVESPVVMLLSASTALSRHWRAYVKVRRISIALGAAFTVIHVLIAFTPFYDIVARDIIGAPAEIIEPGRIGLMIMTPWTFAIAYRRFQQGAMIRFGHTRSVGIGTAIRLTANGLVLLGGYLLQRIPGIVVASSAVVTGVVAEAVYVGLRMRPIARYQIHSAPRSGDPLTLRAFVAFYVPLALTSLISFFVSPIGSAAMSRMPNALGSLAAWPVINGLVFMLRSPGLAYSEVTVALLDEPETFRDLRRFATVLGVALLALAALTVATPLALLWLREVMAVPSDLVVLSRDALALSLLLPPLAVLQSWFQGVIVHSKRTRGITESVMVHFCLTALVLGVGVAARRLAGLHVTMMALEIATLAQVGWLWYRSRPAVRALALTHKAQ